MQLHTEEIKGVSDVAAKMNYFHIQLHYMHWQTTSYEQHIALGKLYETVADMKDEIVEKLIGYTSIRPVVKEVTGIKNISDYSPDSAVKQLVIYANKLDKWASSKGYVDVSQLAQTLSGEAAKTLYLLSLK